MAKVWSFFSHEDDYADLDEELLCQRLGCALALPTVDGPTYEETDWAAFDELEAFFRRSYPQVFAAATTTRIDHSLLVELAGTDLTLDPLILMGHMDVVPVVKGTEADWTYDAFSGHVDREYIWGRGALDMKNQVVGILEAAEYVLSHGGQLQRSLLLCFGQDEETQQSGAYGIAQELKARGVRAALVVDEGDYRIVDAAYLGAPGHMCMRVNVAEKGYADVRLLVKSQGGHSSNPFGGTSLALLAKAIDRVASAPWPIELIDVQRDALEMLAPYINTEPLASLVRGGRVAIDVHAQEIAALLAHERESYPLVTTTVAPTIIQGGSQQANVMPQDMVAVINYRLLPGTSCDDVIKRVGDLLADLPVEYELIEEVSSNPSAVANQQCYGMDKLSEVAARYFTNPEDGSPLTLLPAIVIGATDASNYECICDCCLRFSAFVADDDEVDRGVHGTDERITRRAYMQGIRFMIRLIESCCVYS